MRTFSGVYLENLGDLGSLGLDSEREDGLSILAAEGV